MAGIGPPGTTYSGPVFLSVSGGDISGLFIGGRTSAPGGGGRYGTFYPGVPYGSAASSSAWLYDLQQNGENRSNLAIVDTGETDGSSSTFRIELFDGASGSLVNVVDEVTLGSRKWIQLSSILKEYAPATASAYARVTRIAGSNPFLCYAVINDGGSPGQGSDDGAFVAMDGSEDASTAPVLSVTPTSLSFGNVTVGTTKDLSLSVRSSGSAPLTVSSAKSDKDAFTVTSPATPFTMLPAGEEVVTVRFAPSAAGNQSGNLTIASGDPARPTVLVPVLGSG